MANDNSRIAALIAAEIGARAEQAAAAIQLLDEGSTVPFIARYRKEVTGGLDDTAPACYVSVSDGEPAFTDGPRTLGPDRLGGFAVVSVDSEQSARHWAGRIAAACGWPQEVRRFLPGPGDPSSAAR